MVAGRHGVGAVPKTLCLSQKMEEDRQDGLNENALSRLIYLNFASQKNWVRRVVLLEEICHRGWDLRSQKPMPGSVSIPLPPSFGGAWPSQADAVGLPCPRTNLESLGAATEHPVYRQCEENNPLFSVGSCGWRGRPSVWNGEKPQVPVSWHELCSGPGSPSR